MPECMNFIYEEEFYDQDKELELFHMQQLEDDWFVDEDIVQSIKECEYSNYLKSFAEEYEDIY